MKARSAYVPGKVSVVIPCYNRGPYLAEAIESVLGQTYQAIELIVVDDGSTDDSRAVAAEYGDRLTLLQHPGGVNRGQSASINLGIGHSDGEYLAVLDSDDVWVLDKLEKQVEVLEGHSEIGLVYGNALMIEGDGTPLCVRYGPDHAERNDHGRILVDCYFSVPSNSLVRRSVMDQAGTYNEDLRAAQDHDMAIRISEVTKLAYIPEVMFHYRRHGDSISARSAELRWRNGFRILDAAIRRHEYPGSIIRKRRAVLHFRVAQCYLQQNRYFAAGSHLLRAFLFDPARSIKVLGGSEPITSPN